MSGGGGRAAFGAVFRRLGWRILVALPLFPLVLLMTVPEPRSLADHRERLTPGEIASGSGGSPGRADLKAAETMASGPEEARARGGSHTRRRPAPPGSSGAVSRPRPSSLKPGTSSRCERVRQSIRMDTPFVTAARSLGAPASRMKP